MEKLIEAVSVNLKGVSEWHDVAVKRWFAEDAGGGIGVPPGSGGIRRGGRVGLGGIQKPRRSCLMQNPVDSTINQRRVT